MTRTVALTFDNLGEAAEVEQGTWPADAPRGQHPSVVRALPRLLDLLAELDLRATFFVEARNTIDYPDALHEIAGRGHDLGFHAWSHERWGELAPEKEAENVARSFAAYRDRELAVHAFRPPGGGLHPGSARLLREHGVAWCSALGTRAGLDDAAMAHLPFRWELVDATYLFPPFAELRERLGLPADPLDADAAGQHLRAALNADPDPTAATLILHPFLMADDDLWPMHEELLRDLAAGGARVVPGGVVAAELLGRHAAPRAELAAA